MIQASHILLFVLAVACGAIADGLNEKGVKKVGHPVEGAEKVLLLITGVVLNTWLILIAYVAYRVALFDPIKNISKGQKWYYMSKDEDAPLWDRVLSKVPTHGLTFIRVIFLAFAVAFTIKEL